MEKEKKIVVMGGSFNPPTTAHSPHRQVRAAPRLDEKLLETEGRILINGNNKQETFWGMDLYSWTGENSLGKIIMKIREKEMEK